MTLAWRDYDDSMKRHREATVLPPWGLFGLLLQSLATAFATVNQDWLPHAERLDRRPRGSVAGTTRCRLSSGSIRLRGRSSAKRRRARVSADVRLQQQFLRRRAATPRHPARPG